jgi:hypothetical protein
MCPARLGQGLMCELLERVQQLQACFQLPRQGLLSKALK